MNVLVVDDHPLFVEALKIWLKQLDQAMCFDVAVTLNEIETCLQSTVCYDLILLDLSLPDMENTSEAVGDICQQAYPTPVVIISSQENAGIIRCCMKAGASGYFPKSLDGPTIISGLKSVLLGHVISPKMKVYDVNDVDLTDTQRQILAFIGQGLSNQQIAQKMNYTRGTVKQYISTILQLLGVDNRMQAANKFRMM